MHLLRQLDEVCPDWQRRYGSDPVVAAVELGLIDEDDLALDEVGGELDFSDDATLRRLTEGDDYA